MSRGPARAEGRSTQPQGVGENDARQAPHLECRGVSRSFCGPRGSLVHALRGVELVVAPGECLALVGPSGSGKSTLLAILAGLLRPSSGVVLEDGAVVNDPTGGISPHRRSQGVLLQGLGLWPHLTVLGNVAFALPPGAGQSRRDRRDLAAHVLAEVGLGKLLDRRPHELSGGERQRAAWARATAGRPRLLLLDEPFTSLDPALEAELVRLTAAELATGRVTVVLATHRAEGVRALRPRVLELPHPALDSV